MRDAAELIVQRIRFWRRRKGLRAMRHPIFALAVALALAPSAPMAQDGAAPSDALGAVSDAATALREAATEKILVGDMHGQPLTGPSGEKVGTVRDLAVVPGGRLVAVVVELSDGERVALPYQTRAVSSAAEALDLSVPVDTREILEDARVAELSELLGL